MASTAPVDDLADEYQKAPGSDKRQVLRPTLTSSSGTSNHDSAALRRLAALAPDAADELDGFGSRSA